ncbi:MAG: hypothetical protein HUU49_03920 [Candidatus Buchananbacteria bacterium]|nr:hypothetical protein [Candidatus Buchananbacteria bacterium]
MDQKDQPIFDQSQARSSVNEIGFADSDIRQLLEENLQATKQVQESLAKINRWIAFQKVWGVIKTLIIIIPLLLGLIYLPALLQNVISPYQELLKVGLPDTAGDEGLLDKVNELLNANQNTNQ